MWWNQTNLCRHIGPVNCVWEMCSSPAGCQDNAPCEIDLCQMLTLLLSLWIHILSLLVPDVTQTISALFTEFVICALHLSAGPYEITTNCYYLQGRSLPHLHSPFIYCSFHSPPPLKAQQHVYPHHVLQIAMYGNHNILIFLREAPWFSLWELFSMPRHTSSSTT